MSEITELFDVIYHTMITIEAITNPEKFGDAILADLQNANLLELQKMIAQATVKYLDYDWIKENPSELEIIGYLATYVVDKLEELREALTLQEFLDPTRGKDNSDKEQDED